MKSSFKPSNLRSLRLLFEYAVVFHSTDARVFYRHPFCLLPFLFILRCTATQFRRTPMAHKTHHAACFALTVNGRAAVLLHRLGSHRQLCAHAHRHRVLGRLPAHVRHRHLLRPRLPYVHIGPHLSHHHPVPLPLEVVGRHSPITIAARPPCTIPLNFHLWMEKETRSRSPVASTAETRQSLIQRNAFLFLCHFTSYY